MNKIYHETLDMPLPPQYHIMPEINFALTMFNYESNFNETASFSVEDPESELDVEQGVVTKLGKRRR